MTVNVDEIVARLNPRKRRKLEERTAELIAEEMTLRELHKTAAPSASFSGPSHGS